MANDRIPQAAARGRLSRMTAMADPQTTGKLTAPWSDETVAALNAQQRAGRFHPYTCPGDHLECADRRELIATREGWVCACGKYTQEWAHG